jgi:hypothetical protein
MQNRSPIRVPRIARFLSYLERNFVGTAFFRIANYFLLTISLLFDHFSLFKAYLFTYTL